MSAPKVSLASQIKAVDHAASRLGMPPMKTSPGVIEMERQHLEAAARSLRWIEANAEKLKGLDKP